MCPILRVIRYLCTPSFSPPPLSLSLSLSLCRGRQRYVDDEFDLDLSYITDRVIGKEGSCMGQTLGVVGLPLVYLKIFLNVC